MNGLIGFERIYPGVRFLRSAGRAAGVAFLIHANARAG